MQGCAWALPPARHAPPNTILHFRRMAGTCFFARGRACVPRSAVTRSAVTMVVFEAKTRPARALCDAETYWANWGALALETAWVGA
jgi:hypothetical protein